MAYLTASTFTDIFYIARKVASIAGARQAVRTCLEAFEICDVTHHTLQLAETLSGNDFEDNLQIACATLQNLCKMLAGGMCSCVCQFNGMTVCCYNFAMGLCKYEHVDGGVCFTCTSGDPQCCQMIQACCDSICCCLEAGCTCCFMLNNTPVCCGYSDSKSTPKTKK